MQLDTVIRRLEQFCLRNGIGVRRKMIVQASRTSSARTMGVSMMGCIHLRLGMEPVEEVGVFIHEITHELLHDYACRTNSDLDGLREL